LEFSALTKNHTYKTHNAVIVEVSLFDHLSSVLKTNNTNTPNNVNCSQSSQELNN
jgi:hypothetical protein